MNCMNCGAVLPQGAQVCAACGAPVSPMTGYQSYTAQNGFGGGFDPTAYPMQGYPQGSSQTGYQQSSSQAGYPQGGYGQGFGPGGYTPPPAYGQSFDPTAYGQNNYAQQEYGGLNSGYQNAYDGYRAGGERGAFLNALSYLPRVLSGLLRDPGETLQGMMERGDVYTGGVVAGLSLVLTFLAAMIMTRGAISLAFGGLSSIFGFSPAGDAASMNQGINYIAGKVAPSVGGIAALCQVFALVLPAAVALVYLCTLRRVRFSYLLASNLLAITTLPSIAAALLCMVFSLLSPVLGVLMITLGEVCSYVLVCLVIAHITGQPEQHSAMVKLAIVCVSVVVKLLFIQLVGGSLTAMVLRTFTSLMSAMGSLL